MKRISTITCFVVLLFACNSDSDIENKNDLLSDFAFADSVQTQTIISEEIIENMIHSIPSPIEMTSLIISTGVDFDESILADPERAENYETAHSKALNLGVYGAELGYLNIYGKTLLAVDYLTVVRTLAKDLGVEQFFDFHTLRRLASSSDNIDSLINITTKGFSRMENFLREQNRTKASVMIVTGTFVEGLYIAGEIATKTPSKELLDRIGEQKMSLNNLVIMLEVYKKDEEISKLITDFKSLKTLYDEVKIITTYGEPVTKEVDGMLVIEDQSTSEVKMSQELLEKIIVKIRELRTKIV